MTPEEYRRAVELFAQLQDMAVEERQAARERQEWQRADVLRDQLRDLGWEVRDGPDGGALIPVQ